MTDVMIQPIDAGYDSDDSDDSEFDAEYIFMLHHTYYNPIPVRSWEVEPGFANNDNVVTPEIVLTGIPEGKRIAYCNRGYLRLVDELPEGTDEELPYLEEIYQGENAEGNWVPLDQPENIETLRAHALQWWNEPHCIRLRAYDQDKLDAANKIKQWWSKMFWSPNTKVGLKRLNRSYEDENYSVW